jgi:hypothetical protein
MASKKHCLTPHPAAAAAMLVVLALAAPAAAFAASTTAEHSSQSVTTTATVTYIDPATRRIVVRGASGDLVSVKAPPEVRNFSQIKVGDKVKATYTVETEIVISSPNTPLPADTEATVAARAAKGELPAAVVANHVIVTGAVLAIDMANHTLKIVSPQGGEVHTITVKRADRQKAMAKLKVGDKITAYVTESMLLSVHPA